MKKLIGATVVASMLILGQPLMAFADALGPRTLNFDDLASLITEQNLKVQINENDRLKAHAGFSGLKKDIEDLEDEIDSINRQRDMYRDQGNLAAVIGLGAEKRGLLEALKQLERTEVDQPTYEVLADIKATMDNDIEIRTAESLFIAYHQLNLAYADISLSIQTIQDQQAVMQLQESLGLVSRNSMNGLRTTLVDMQTKLKNVKFQQDSLERQLKNLLNDQDDSLIIGSLPSTYEEIVRDDEEVVEEEDVISEDKDVISEDKDVISEDKDVISEDKDVISEDKDVISEDEDVISEDEDAINDDDKEEDADFLKALENSYMIQLQEHQIVSLQTTLERTKKDNGMSSNQYKIANFELENAELKLLQLKDKLRADYNNLLDEIVKKQNDLLLAEQNLGDEMVVLNEAQVKLGLGMISKLEMESATSAHLVKQNAVQTKQIDLFNAKNSYDWFIKGMAWS